MRSCRATQQTGHSASLQAIELISTSELSEALRMWQGREAGHSASVITSKAAINDHFKTGQRNRGQDMKLFYRASSSSGKLFLILL